MKENEQIYCVMVFLAWISGVLAFWDIMTFGEGASGTLAVFAAAFAVWVLHDKNAKW